MRRFLRCATKWKWMIHQQKQNVCQNQDYCLAGLSRLLVSQSRLQESWLYLAPPGQQTPLQVSEDGRERVTPAVLSRKWHIDRHPLNPVNPPDASSFHHQYFSRPGKQSLFSLSPSSHFVVYCTLCKSVLSSFRLCRVLRRSSTNNGSLGWWRTQITAELISVSFQRLADDRELLVSGRSRAIFTLVLPFSKASHSHVSSSATLWPFACQCQCLLGCSHTSKAGPHIGNRKSCKDVPWKGHNEKSL